MGLYDDLNNDIAEAFNSDLSDAMQTMIYIEPQSLYDPATGAVVNTPIEHETRGVISPYIEAKGMNGNGSSTTSSEGSNIAIESTIIILDSEISMKPIVSNMINVGSKVYKIITVETDPAGASHTLGVTSNGY